MSPAAGDDGKFKVNAPLLVSQKYPSPDVAVKVAVFGVVSQFTDPDLPKPDCEAPLAKVTVSPEAPKVIVVPD